jgi:hypothetical protein
MRIRSEKCQVLTEQQRGQRMQFARDFRTGNLPLVNLIFCDESRFVMGPDNHWVWRRQANIPKDFLLKPAIHKIHKNFNSRVGSD